MALVNKVPDTINICHNKRPPMILIFYHRRPLYCLIYRDFFTGSMRAMILPYIITAFFTHYQLLINPINPCFPIPFTAYRPILFIFITPRSQFFQF